VIFGSQAKGTAQETISAALDGHKSHEIVYSLWRLARHIDAHRADSRGTRQWEEDDSSAIIEIARREGEVIGVQ